MLKFEIHLNANDPESFFYKFEGYKEPFKMPAADDSVFTWGRELPSTLELAESILLIAARQIEKGLTTEELLIRFVQPKVHQLAHNCLYKLNRRTNYKLMFDSFLWHNANKGYCSLILPSGI